MAARTGSTQTSAVEDAVARRLAELDRESAAQTGDSQAAIDDILRQLTTLLTDDDRLAVRESDADAAAYVELRAVVQRRGRPYRDFGRGSGHPAQLNLGDTFSYALAHTAEAKLLFVGNDFGHTDIRPELP